MPLPKKYNNIVINVLLAVVASLVINFSYLLAIRQQDFTPPEETGDTLYCGILHVSKDGYGYIVTDIPAVADTLAQDDSLCDTLARNTPARDSIYLSFYNIRRLELIEGSHMSVLARPSRIPGGSKVLAVVKEVDGVPFDYRAVYNRPADTVLFGLQFGFFFVVALALLLIMTAGALGDTSWKFFLKRGSLALATMAVLFFLMPVMQFRSDEIVPNFMNTRNGEFLIDPVAILKCLFVLVFALLYGRTYQLIYQKEGIMLENEQLKSENLRARYNTLINQMNPHFLFNSLNSLSSLVREGKNDDAVRYIDRLSDTFRYTIRNEPHTTTTLAEELEFAAAYKYLLEVRYDEKLFIDIDIDPGKLEWMLPTFSIQPLVENAVKHNTITRGAAIVGCGESCQRRNVLDNHINIRAKAARCKHDGFAVDCHFPIRAFRFHARNSARIIYQYFCCPGIEQYWNIELSYLVVERRHQHGAD